MLEEDVEPPDLIKLFEVINPDIKEKYYITTQLKYSFEEIERLRRRHTQ